jgi:hypothetical protein
MRCRSIADVLRGLGEIPPSEMAIVNDGLPEPPVPSGRWLDCSKVAASTARDVVERVMDDRSRAERRAQSSEALAVARLARPPKFRFGALAKTGPKRTRKVERTAEVKEYYRQYMRERRAAQRVSSP